MEFRVGNKDFELKFGVGFLRELDKEFEIEYQRQRFGVGLETVYPFLEIDNLPTLATVIRCAITKTVSQIAVDKAIDKYGEEHGDYDELFEEVKNELKKSPATKRTVGRAVKRLNKEEAKKEA